MALVIPKGKIKTSSPCKPGWKLYLKNSGAEVPDDYPETYSGLIKKVGILNTLWVCRADEQYEDLWRQYAVSLASDLTTYIRDARYANLLEDSFSAAKGEYDKDSLYSRYAELKVEKVDWSDKTQAATALAWMSASPNISLVVWELARCYVKAMTFYRKQTTGAFNLEDLCREMGNRFLSIVGE